MHERGLVSAAAVELLSSLGDEKIDSVTLSVGPDTDRGVVEEAWRSATAGTPIATARLELAAAMHELVCLECSTAYWGGKLTTCSECGGNGLVVERAPEVSIAGWGKGRVG
ncbi:MAG: hydrogenase/urease maturation nickel metallochaperone HypA [Acidimicrobiia bacterium]